MERRAEGTGFGGQGKKGKDDNEFVVFVHIFRT